MRFSLRTMLEAVFVFAVVLMMWRLYHSPGIRRGETLEIRATGTLPDLPINGIHKVEENGSVALGPAYGTVSVEGMQPDAARDAVTTQLKKILANPEVSVSRTGDDALILLQAANQKLEAENTQLKAQLADCEAKKGN